MGTLGKIVTLSYNAGRCLVNHWEHSKAWSPAGQIKFETVGIACMAPDVIAITFNAAQIIKKLDQRVFRHWYPSNSDDDIALRNNWQGRCFLAALVVSAIASYVAVKTLNQALIPQIDLNDVLKHVIHQESKDIMAYWIKPRQFEQGLLCARLIQNLFLAALSSKPLFYLSNAFFQGMTVWKVAQLQQIGFTKIFHRPFETQLVKIEEGGTLQEFQQTVKQISIEYFARSHTGRFSSNLKEFDRSSDVQSAITCLYDLATSRLKESSWSRYWSVGVMQNAKFDETSRMDYQIGKLQPSKLSQAKSMLWDSFLRNVGRAAGMVQSAQTNLIYCVSLRPLEKDPPFLSFLTFRIKVLHEDEMWRPFQWFDWLTKRFFVWGHMARRPTWISAKISFL